MFNIRDLTLSTSGILSSGVVPKSFKGVSIDSRKINEGEVFLALKGKNFDGHDFIDQAISKGARAIIYSDASGIGAQKKGVAYIKVADTLTALGAIARFHRERFDIPVIAITGSSGKTTTKEMISWVLSSKYNVLKNEGTQNNQIGVPLTLLRIHSKHDVCVVELGTNRKGEIRYLSQISSPNIGVITNIGPAHLEFLGSLKGVYKEKVELLRMLKPPGIAFLNKSDINLANLCRVRSKPFFFYGVNRECEISATDIAYHEGSVSFLLNGSHSVEIKHCALHNVSNALAAIGCGLTFGLEIRAIKERLECFDSPQMRLKEIALRECVVLDDSYNSNPQSLKQAIDVLCRKGSLSGRRILIMGDMLELGKESEGFHIYFGRYVSKKPLHLLLTFGDLSRSTCEMARKNGMGPESAKHFCATADIFDFLKNNIRAGDVILVKGSRSMKMEKIVEFLKERF